MIYLKYSYIYILKIYIFPFSWVGYVAKFHEDKLNKKINKITINFRAI